MRMRTAIERSGWSVAACAALVLAGSGGPSRREVRQDIVANKPAEAERKIDEIYHHHLSEYGWDSPQIGNSRHLLLWRLERGVVDLLQTEYLNALGHFREATRVAREGRTRSLARGVAAVVINDNLTRWSGEPFELVRIPYYAMLANLALAQRVNGTLLDADPVGIPAAKGAVPEPRRAADALLYADRAASGAIALEEHLRALAAGEFGTSDYRDDGWLHLIAAAVRAATAESGDDRAAAELYARRAGTAFAAAGATPAVAQALIARITERSGQGMPPPGHGSVLLIEEVGFVPKREALTVYVVTGAPPRGVYLDLGGVFIYVDDPNPDALPAASLIPIPGEIIRALTGGRFGVFGCEVPVMPRRAARPAAGSLAIDQGAPVALEWVSDVEEHARTCFNDHRGRRLATIIARTAGKLIAARQGIGAIQVDGRDSSEARVLRDVLWFLTSALVTASEQADTRCWTLLPNRVAATLVHIPAGMRSLGIVHADGVSRHLGRINVRPGQLAIVCVRSFPAGVDHVGGGQ